MVEHLSRLPQRGVFRWGALKRGNARFPESEKGRMLEDRERLKQECVQAASAYYGLQEAGCVYPVVRELPLERHERADWMLKSAVLVASRPALMQWVSTPVPLIQG